MFLFLSLPFFLFLRYPIIFLWNQVLDIVARSQVSFAFFLDLKGKRRPPPSWSDGPE